MKYTSRHHGAYVSLVAAAVACVSVPAQGQTANVTLYGSLRLDVEHVAATHATNGAAVTSTARVNSNQTRFGMRGEEDLGVAGLKAVFQIETGFDASANGANSANVGAGAAAAGNTIASFDTWAGLSSDYGRLLLGQMDTPYKNADAITGLFLNSGIQSQWSLGGNCSGPNNSTSSVNCFTRRQANSVRYDSPVFGGAVINAQYGIENEAPANNNAKATNLSVGVRYTGGPLRAALNYEQHNDFRGVAASGTTDRGLKAQAGYTVGPVYLAAGYERLKYDVLSATGANAGDLRRDRYILSARYALGSGALVGSYNRANNGKGSAPDNTAIGAIRKGPNTGAKQYTVGYEHDLSKRTQLWLYYTRIDNQANADYRFVYNTFATGGAGADPSGIVVGMIHNF